MRLLVDAQLPPALCDWFGGRGIEADHVRDILGGQTPDRDIALHAERHQLILLTKDDDFLLRHPPVRSRPLLTLRLAALRQHQQSRSARVAGTALAGDRDQAWLG